jgi:8-oxo-dGTP diphosphatase
MEILNMAGRPALIRKAAVARPIDPTPGHRRDGTRPWSKRAPGLPLAGAAGERPVRDDRGSRDSIGMKSYWRANSETRMAFLHPLVRDCVLPYAPAMLVTHEPIAEASGHLRPGPFCVLAPHLQVRHSLGMKQPKFRAPVLAAGGIVVREASEQLIAVVRLRKNKSWVLPKGKLKPGEDAQAGARREVMEETGHDVSIEGFLGSMSHTEGGKLKVVQFWRMRATDKPVRKLMDDVTAVKWLPLQQAVDTLTRPHEKAFLMSVGHAALPAAEPLAREAIAEPAAPPAPEDGGLRKSNTLFEAIRAWLRRLAA